MFSYLFEANKGEERGGQHMQKRLSLWVSLSFLPGTTSLPLSQKYFLTKLQLLDIRKW